ncbi:MAG: DUF1919 domain-containing protein, partial [Bacillota bacterium]|nr:DUF1919 domain-containing protein [Bacillota bacterium]
MKKIIAYLWDYLLCDKIGRLNRILFRNRIERSKLINDNFTILSQNCIGAVMYHDLGKCFLSPTINIGFDPNEFITFLEDMEYYLNAPIKIISSEYSYPVGKLGEGEHQIITLHFVHYSDCQVALEKWNERKKRINRNNIFVVCQDANMSYETIQKFDNLKQFESKILFTAKEYKEFSSTVYLKNYKNKGYVDN